MTAPPGALDRSAILGLVPHQGSMCLLERMERCDAHGIVCTATGFRAPDHPLRSRRGLASTAAIEYAAQAMALHGALVGAGPPAGESATPGMLASARGVTFHTLWLDRLPQRDAGADALRIEATRQAGDARRILYAFSVTHADRPVAAGRAAVVLGAMP